LLLHITGGPEMTLGDANEVGESLAQSLPPNSNVIWGARMDPAYAGRLEAIVIFTGIKSPYVVGRTSFEEKKSSWDVSGV